MGLVAWMPVTTPMRLIPQIPMATVLSIASSAKVVPTHRMPIPMATAGTTGRRMQTAMVCLIAGRPIPAWRTCARWAVPAALLVRHRTANETVLAVRGKGRRGVSRGGKMPRG